MWIIWLLIAAILIAGEAATTGFFLLWFGVGAIVAAVLALLGVTSLAIQIIAFLIVSIVLVIFSKTILQKYLRRTSGDADIKTGVEKMIGKVVTVVASSQGIRHECAVKTSGSVWTAFPVEGEAPLIEGESVEIERIEGNSVYVRRRNPRREFLFTGTSEKQ
jgi:inner membrane protein